MNTDGISRRHLLATGATLGTGTLAYATDNPLHRSDVERVTIRRADGSPDPGTFWYAEHVPAVPEATLTQLVGVRYRGLARDGHRFDVLVVAIGRRTSVFGDGPLVTAHSMGVRGRGGSATVGADEGTTDSLDSGVVESPERIASATDLRREDIDDQDVLADHVGDGSPFGDARDLSTVDRLLTRYETGRDDGGHERLTRAGLLYGLVTATTSAAARTPAFEGRGETYRCDTGDVLAHVMRYRALSLSPAEDRVGLKAASVVPRPSLVGTPEFEGGLVVTWPR